MRGADEPRAALVAVTKPGAVQAHRLAQYLPGAAVFVAEEQRGLMDGLSNKTISFRWALRDQIPRLLEGYEQVVFFLSVGAVVRLIAPHLRSKYDDPGVLAIDGAARFVVPVLSGHVGGANAYAGRLADLLGATAVITTASDATRTISVDILGRELGWHVEAPKINLTRVAARVVNGEPIAFVQEASSKAWWPGAEPLPEDIRLFTRFEDVDLDQYRAVLLVTRRAIPSSLWQRLEERLVVYRPPVGES